MEEELREPVSPTGQYFTSSAISISVIAVLESEIPIDDNVDSQTITLVKDLFLPINPRFNSIMMKENNGKKYWKRVEVKVQDHVHVPKFPESDAYDDHFTEYLSKIAMEELPQSRPLWEIHIIKYPTKTSAGSLVFKLHHALGDGFSLMGALLSCLQRADNPQVPLTFPAFKAAPDHEGGTRDVVCGNVSRVGGWFCGVMNTVVDFGWSLLKSSVMEDDRTPIRSGEEGVEFRPITITTFNFSLHQIKQIKSILHVTINDVICGVLFLGVRMYMQATKQELRNLESTALVLLNTRNIAGYKSLSEMVEPDANSPWGNQFAFLHVSVPKFASTDPTNNDPLQFVFEAQKLIKRKRNSAAVLLTGKLLNTLGKLRGPEVTAKYIHSTLKNASMTISNMIGPVEKMALSNHPIKGLYFMVVGVPQNLTITMLSYMGNLRVAVGTENGLIDAAKFKTCVQSAFDTIFKAAVSSPTVENV